MSEFRYKIEHFSKPLCELIIKVHLTEKPEVYKWYSNHYQCEIASAFIFIQDGEICIETMSPPEIVPIDMSKYYATTIHRCLRVKKKPTYNYVIVIDGATGYEIIKLTQQEIVMPIYDRMAPFIQLDALVLDKESTPLYAKLIAEVGNELAEAIHVDATV